VSDDFELIEFGSRTPVRPPGSGDEGEATSPGPTSKKGGKQKDGKKRNRKKKDTRSKGAGTKNAKKRRSESTKKAKALGRRQVPPGEAPSRGVLVPLDQWTRVLNQLGNLHQAGQQLAEARERAARAETESAFFKERLREVRAELEELRGRRREGDAS
jgi:hypothetical protein